MKIKKLNKDDQQKLMTYLEPCQLECIFIYSNLRNAGMNYFGKEFQGEYFAAFNQDESQILGVLAHYWNGNLMMHASSADILKQCCAYFAKHSLRPIAGIMGLDEQAKLVIEELKLNDKQFSINHAEGLFKLNLDYLNITPLVMNTSIISVSEVSKNTILDWMKAYAVEALGAEIDEALDSKAESTYQRLMALGAYVLTKNDEPVSLCGFNARVEQTCQLGPVWTPPIYRNKGYAREVVGHALLNEKNRGYQKSILFTNHPAAERVYINLGFKKFSHFRLALLKKATSLS